MFVRIAQILLKQFERTHIFATKTGPFHSTGIFWYATELPG